MRTIALSFVLLAVCASAAPAPDTPFSALAKLSTDLSENDATGAMAFFDSSMKGYGDLQRNVESLAEQTTILSALDVIEDKDNSGVHTLSVDWYITLTLMSDPTYTERRREQVTVEMREVGGKWKITSMSTVSILDPIKIQ
ncbi:MAG TPA: hypothetical protein VG273_03685 [Bryobacteraceae bacterium]|jgi:hypothetical protein|nr:hypothetical protein [Bryobacteraceae bacterium]